MKRRPAIVLGLACIGGLIWWLSGDGDQRTEAGTRMVAVTVPERLSDDALRGRTAFDANCASCHGRNAAGQAGVAPPLVHKIYEPSHHGDQAFHLAATRGVRGHHWPFGDMPPVEGIESAQIDDIITYIRELQRANGIN